MKNGGIGCVQILTVIFGLGAILTCLYIGKLECGNQNEVQELVLDVFMENKEYKYSGLEWGIDPMDVKSSLGESLEVSLELPNALQLKTKTEYVLAGKKR